MLSLTILVTLGTTAVYAQPYTSEKGKEIQEIINNEYKPTIIPKPNYIPGPDITETKTERNTLVSNFLPRLTISLIGLAGVAALIVILISGLRMSLNFGDEDTINKAKNHIVYAIIGLIIAMLSYTIVKITVSLDFEETPQTSTEAENAARAFGAAAEAGGEAGAGALNNSSEETQQTPSNTTGTSNTSNTSNTAPTQALGNVPAP